MYVRPTVSVHELVQFRLALPLQHLCVGPARLGRRAASPHVQRTHYELRGPAEDAELAKIIVEEALGSTVAWPDESEGTVAAGKSVIVTSYHGHRWRWRPHTIFIDDHKDTVGGSVDDNDDGQDKENDGTVSGSGRLGECGEVVLDLSQGATQRHELIILTERATERQEL